MNKTSLQLEIDGKLKEAVEAFTAQNPREGFRNVSELTEHLWLAHIERSGMKLLNCTEIAKELRRARHYVSAMKAAGYVMKYGNRDVMSNVLTWLEEHPKFRTTEYVARSRTGKGRRRLPGCQVDRAAAAQDSKACGFVAARRSL